MSQDVGNRRLDHRLLRENTESPMKAQACVSVLSFPEEHPLNSVGRKHTSVWGALHKGKEGTGDPQVSSIISLVSRSNGSLQIKSGNQEGAKIIPHG